MKTMLQRLTYILFMLASAGLMDAYACTRVVYVGPEQTVLTGRTMDFFHRYSR